MEEGSVTAVTFNRAVPWGSLLEMLYYTKEFSALRIV